MTAINLTCPTGMSGLAVEPWSKGEIYAVAANWAQASAPVYVYGERGWDIDHCGRQVADFRHSARAALEAQVEYAIATSEGIPSDEVDADEVDAICDDAVEIDDTDATDEE
jgi:hypothetical protein